MVKKQAFDFVVIGGGPGGYVAAIRAAHHGKKVALIERDALGGTCLNRGCIPSKTLIHNAALWKQTQSLKDFGIEVSNPSFDFSKMASRKDTVVAKMKKGLEGLVATNKITLFKGTGTLNSPHEVRVSGTDAAVLEAKTIIIATGSEPRNIPAFPFDEEQICSSTALLQRTKLPKSLAIVGGGVIGCEFACLYAELGVKVTVIEALDRLLPMEALDVSKHLEKSFVKKGIEVHTKAMVSKIEKKKGKVSVELKGQKAFDAEIALVAVGRMMNTEKIGLESAGLSTDKQGFISVNDSMQTSVPHIYAIGDITGKWLLAHVASHQGIVAVDHALGKSARMHYEAIPSVTYTHPEIATCGLSYEQALEKGIKAKKGAFPFQALGKAQASADTEGFAQVITDSETGQLIGAQVVGHEASNLIAEMAVAINNELTDLCVAETVHAHPTLAEAWLEATLACIDHSIHLPKKGS